jgi:allantoin racemase
MNILLINPNTSTAMTRAISDAARAVAAPGTRIMATQASFGAASIESYYDEAYAAAGVAEQMRSDQARSADAVVVACFGDPGLDAARECTDAPVIGIAEAAFHTACLVAHRFSVVTTLRRTCPMAEHLLQRYGLAARCAGVHGTDIPVLALETCDEATVALIEAAARQALAEDSSEAIVLGCAGMAPLCAQLSARLGVPVIDGVSAAIKLAEGLHGLGLKTSKRGSYARPLPKPYQGWAAGLGW